MDSVPIYHPHPLPSMQAICDALVVSRERVKKWRELGAPIAKEGEGVNTLYSAELVELQQWRNWYFSERGAVGV